MAQIISFLPKQVIASSQSTAVDYYSEIFDVANFVKIDVILQVFGNSDIASGGAVTGLIQESADPNLGDNAWITASGSNPLSVTGILNTRTSFSGYQRYIRAKIPGNGKFATVLMQGVAHESS